MVKRFIEMKFSRTQALLAPLFALLLGACASMGPQDTDQFIFLDESETLFVKFNHSANPIYEANAPDLADTMRRNRRDDFMYVMEELLHLYQLPIQVHVLAQWEEPGDGPLLEIFAPRFEQDRTGDLVATLSVKLSKYGELNTLGSYSQRDTPPIGGSRQRMDEAFRDVIRKPLREMFDDLQQHFPTPEETESIQAPLNPLGEG